MEKVHNLARKDCIVTGEVNVDLSAPEFQENPYPTYAKLRSQDPIHRVTLPDDNGVWLVTRYEDVEQVLRDNRFTKDYRNALSPEQLEQMPPEPEKLKPLLTHMLAKDPPDHTRLRKLVSKAFTPRFIEGLRPRIQEIADELLLVVEEQAKKSGKREMNLIDDYAFPLPITVIAEMLGVPTADREKFREWSNIAVSSDLSQEYAERLIPVMEQFTEYLHLLFEKKRQEPEDDLITGLLQTDEDGQQLSEDELLSMVFVLIVAGHETTVNLIGNGMLALLEHPDQMEKLKQNKSIIDNTIEELLRYDGPVKVSTDRFAKEDVQVNGVTIPKGEMVLVLLGSANHDPARFPQAEELNIERETRGHLAFGKGIHHCLGAPLARLEGQIAFETLLRKMPNLQLAVASEELSRHPGLLIRGLVDLPVTF